MAKVLILADLFGLSTHGLSRLESYGERLDVGGIAKDSAITVERVAPALVTVDGGNGAGPLVGMHGLRAAMEVARECGIAADLAEFVTSEELSTAREGERRKLGVA